MIFEHTKAKAKDMKRGDVVQIMFQASKDANGGETFFMKVLDVVKGVNGYTVSLNFSDIENEGSMSTYHEGEFVTLLSIIKNRYSKQDLILTSKNWSEKVERTFTKQQWDIYLLDCEGDADSIAKAASMMEKDDAIAYMKKHIEALESLSADWQ